MKKVSETVSKYGGRIVKGTLGTIQAAAGAAQVYVGGALCATGIGAVIGAPLMIHGAADVIQGVGNTYYAIEGEDKEMSNFVQEGYKAAGRTVGRLIGGEKGAQVGEKIGSGVFVTVDVALSFVSGKAILDGAKAAKQGTTFFKGTQEVLKATTKNVATNVKSTFKAVKELPGKVKDTGSNIVKKFSSLFVKESKVATNTVKETKPFMSLDLQFFANKGEAVNTSKKVTADFIVGPNGTVVSNNLYQMSNADFVQEVADIADMKVNQKLLEEGKKTTGHVAGSLKHGEAEKIINNYQVDIADRGLVLEQNYKNHIAIPSNELGSTRLDVYDRINNQVYDYKFVIDLRKGKGLSDKQTNKIINQGPIGLSKTDIHEINSK